MDFEIVLSGLEHFCFCKYQWWLNYVENEWLDNVHTTLGNIVHKNVDNKDFTESRGNVKIFRSVPVYSDKFNLYGIADLVEFHNSDDKLTINVVEYKKGKPSEDKSPKNYDGLQLYAQMLCLREICNCEVNGYVFYDKIKRRSKLQNEEFFNNLLIDTLTEMKSLIKSHTIPSKNIGNHCRACSMYEICLPKIPKEKQK